MFGWLEIVVLIAFLAYGVFWLWMLKEIGGRPDWVYERAGESKGLWFVVVLVLQFFGTLGYFFMVRDKLRTIEREGQTTATS